jgi:fluoroacetyl-CoA thioesterase
MNGSADSAGPRPSATLRFTVREADTAAALGSGSLAVLGTPRLLAWMEAATCAALEPDLPPGRTSVGRRVLLEHTAASGVDETLSVLAVLQHRDGRLVRFEVVAEDSGGSVVGRAEVTRVVVDVDRFLARVRDPA